ncbi:hypothetical protein F4778DRAFT_64649 [Xylariomycetidae sp. FL2044]|nr:hypothetical protein F4778DRAFT_64649 [Xylariomycetidae sp. FL2044]
MARHHTCLSAEPHDDNVRDILTHYLGCLEFAERKEFFKDTNKVWEEEVEYFEAEGVSREEAKRRGEKNRDKWKRNCATEERRIEFLRKALERDEKEQEKEQNARREELRRDAQDKGQDEKHLVKSAIDSLVKNVNASRYKWRDSDEYKDNIKDVQSWRKQNGNHIDSVPENISNPSETNATQGNTAAYDPEHDINAAIMQFENGMAVEDIGEDMVKGSFPDHKIKIKRLLEEPRDEEDRKTNILHKAQKSNDETVNYFHLPSNNMTWAEEAIARYFGQTRPDFHAIKRELKKGEKTSTALILKESHWRGQLHGGRQAIHSRFMRPFCEVMVQRKWTCPIIWFYLTLRNQMPYLHWETTRQREKFAETIEEITWNKKLKEEDEENEERTKRIKHWENIAKRAEPKATPKVPMIKRIQETFRIPDSQNEKSLPLPLLLSLPPPSRTYTSFRPLRQRGRILTMASVVKKLKKSEEQLPIDDFGRVTVSNPLGQYLIDAARLYEGMSNYRDKKLLQKFLTSNPPLHPRRTLDQAYYWTLSTTRARDRDQVIYRATTADYEDAHSFDHDRQVWNCYPEDQRGPMPCPECRNNVRMVSRVIMVDQLWMWILDAKTIITCFPKRYGVNKGDSSAVHKSIRMRLGNAREGQVKTVFDLALIIFDECSNTFFDRTRTSENQPHVLEAFSEATGNIMHKQTVAFARLWRWTESARKIYHSRRQSDTSGLHVPLLDINPEGELEKEIKDIVEELGMMLYIKRIHRDVLKQFINHADHILDPSGSLGAEHGRTKTSRNLAAKAEEQGKSENYAWFKQNAEELTNKVNSRIEQLEELQSSAENTADNVKDLLELKQQQASVVQAWQSMRQSDEAMRQGRSIMMFTIVTIVFLPLSFLSSIFGMNVKGLTDSTDWTLSQVFKYIFPISFGVVVIATVLSLSTVVRSALWFAYLHVTNLLFVKTGCYKLYLDFAFPSQEHYRHAIEATEKLKHNVAALRFERKSQKNKKREEVKAGARGENKNKNSNDKKTLMTGLTSAAAVAVVAANGQANGHAKRPGWLPFTNRKKRADVLV